MPKMQQRRGTALQWTTANTVLLAGEIGFETDTGYFKIGDGTTAWNTLLYANPKFNYLSFGVSAPTGFTTSSSSSVSTTGTLTALSLSSGFDLASGYSLLDSNSDQTIAGNKSFTGGVVAQSLKSSFASATARDAAVEPTEGMLCYLEDLNQVTCYLGSAWFPVAGQMPSIEYSRSTNQSVANNNSTTVSILWNTLISSRDTWSYNPGTGVFTTPYTGRYSVSVWTSYAANTTGRRLLSVDKNGASIGTMNHAAPPNGVGNIVLTHTYTASVADGISIGTLQNSGGSLNLTGNVLITYLGP